ncbi:hypothetical protein CPLU01_03799 [Colletotrichum plurivorum]|uniref:Uncharacterized protein n=1 Tax=Colletotrichum plurivorum TaxID=2175906 RepID=A0A8H6KS71_9PEZI|nr:hypothetical protein CPLU01_03799 [Colletotrichum plurivorum]
MQKKGTLKKKNLEDRAEMRGFGSQRQQQQQQQQRNTAAATMAIGFQRLLLVDSRLLLDSRELSRRRVGRRARGRGDDNYKAATEGEAVGREKEKRGRRRCRRHLTGTLVVVLPPASSSRPRYTVPPKGEQQPRRDTTQDDTRPNYRGALAGLSFARGYRGLLVHGSTSISISTSWRVCLEIRQGASESGRESSDLRSEAQQGRETLHLIGGRHRKGKSSGKVQGAALNTVGYRLVPSKGLSTCV